MCPRRGHVATETGTLLRRGVSLKAPRFWPGEFSIRKCQINGTSLPHLAEQSRVLLCRSLYRCIKHVATRGSILFILELSIGTDSLLDLDVTADTQATVP